MPLAGRAEGDGALDLAALHQGGDLLGREVPVAQPRQAGFRQLLHAALRFRAGRRHRLHALHGDHVFALRRHHLGAVHLEQRLALAHGLAGDVDVQPLDIALEPGRDRVHMALVGLDAAGRAHRTAQRAHRGGLGAHAQLLDLLGADADLAGAGLVRALVLAFVDGDVVHAHRVLLGRGRGIGQPHRVAVVEDLARLGRAAGGGRGACDRRVRVARRCAGAEPVAARADDGHGRRRR